MVDKLVGDNINNMQSAKNSKCKGSAFERLISKKLSMWWSNNTNDNLFFRTNSSGGRYTVRQKLGKETLNQEGDICSVHPDSQLFSRYFSIECKNYKNIDLYIVLSNDTKHNTKDNILGWLHKLEEHVICKHPILICKSSHRPTLFISNNYFSTLIDECYGRNIYRVKFYKNNNSYYIYYLDDILSLDPEAMKEYLTEKINEEAMLAQNAMNTLSNKIYKIIDNKNKAENLNE